MELLTFIFDHAVSFCVASVPIVLCFLCVKKHKMNYKSTAIILFLVLIINLYFWIITKDVCMFIYQSIPYVISFLILFIERHAIKKQKK